VNRLDLLFDSKQFAVAFGAAIGESRSVFQTCRGDATAHSEGESKVTADNVIGSHEEGRGSNRLPSTTSNNDVSPMG